MSQESVQIFRTLVRELDKSLYEVSYCIRRLTKKQSSFSPLLQSYENVITLLDTVMKDLLSASALPEKIEIIESFYPGFFKSVLELNSCLSDTMVLYFRIQQDLFEAKSDGISAKPEINHPLTVHSQLLDSNLLVQNYQNFNQQFIEEYNSIMICNDKLALLSEYSTSLKSKSIPSQFNNIKSGKSQKCGKMSLLASKKANFKLLSKTKAKSDITHLNLGGTNTLKFKTCSHETSSVSIQLNPNLISNQYPKNSIGNGVFHTRQFSTNNARPSYFSMTNFLKKIKYGVQSATPPPPTVPALIIM